MCEGVYVVQHGACSCSGKKGGSGGGGREAGMNEREWNMYASGRRYESGVSVRVRGRGCEEGEGKREDEREDKKVRRCGRRHNVKRERGWEDMTMKEEEAKARNVL